MFANTIPFSPAEIESALAQIPSGPGVFALSFHPGGPSAGPAAPSSQDAAREPEEYLAKAADLRRRIQRLVSPPDPNSKRLNLSGRVREISWTETGSEFESLLLLYQALTQLFGSKRALERLRLYPPVFLRFAAENPYPRVYATNRFSNRAAQFLYGPWASREKAERYMEAVLDLFKLRRCFPDLAPDPAFPGCIYSEMKKCLAPCFQGCTDERYAQEAAAVQSFLEQRGAGHIAALATRRNAASAALEFEQAAAIHAELERAEGAAKLAPEIVRPLAQLHAVLIFPRATSPEDGPAVNIFLVHAGVLTEPLPFSTAGMRHPNEKSGSSSLFAHPAAPSAVPLHEAEVPVLASRSDLEERLRALIRQLEDDQPRFSPTPAVRMAHLALLKRWYYRPTTRRAGEIVFPGEDGEWPLQRILRGISRVFVAAAGVTAPASVPAASVPDPRPVADTL